MIPHGGMLSILCSQDAGHGPLETKGGSIYQSNQLFGGKIPRRYAMLMAAGALWTWSFS